MRLDRANVCDWADLWRWRNESREMMIETHEITVREHWRWLRETNSQIWILRDGETRIGVARVSPDDGDVSVIIDSRHRGAGYGSVALQMLIDKTPRNQRLVAKIKPTNVASIVTFARAGFTPTDESNDAMVVLECLR